MTRLPGKIIVTGATGFFGSALCLYLSSSGHQVECWSRNDCDLTDQYAVANLMATSAPDTIFHLAADAVRNPGAKDSGIIERNVAMATNIARHAPISARIINAGSMTEYGFGGTLSEDMSCKPQTDYNKGKLQAGQQAMGIARSRGIEFLHTRIFHLYGPGEPVHRLLPFLLEGLSARKPVNLSDGRQKRDYIHVRDAASVFLSLAKMPREMIATDGVITVNVGTGIGVELRQLAIWIAHSLGAPTDLLNFGSRERSPADEDTLVANVQRLQHLIGHSPSTRLNAQMDFRALMAT
jgi:nucleoside-diphosphate-sugar epimerase